MNRRRLCQLTAAILTRGPMWVLSSSSSSSSIQYRTLFQCIAYRALRQFPITHTSPYPSPLHEATQPLSCNCTSAELTQFDGRARGDDMMRNLTVS